MTNPKTERKQIKIEDLYVNPENFRYLDMAEDEISAILSMFIVKNGEPKKEMKNLALDIAKNGLHEFEQPIVWYDEEIKKYIVIEGNRRISCIKLMKQYKNEKRFENCPAATHISNIEPEKEIETIDCVIYEDRDEAEKVLPKLHLDINGGTGRKQWDAQAKSNAKKDKTNSIIEFIIKQLQSDDPILSLMKSKRWTSKLERVVGFAAFKKAYNISFDKENKMKYTDTEEQVTKMMKRLIEDLIKNPATNNTRSKNEFDAYVLSLPEGFKTQVKEKTDSKQDSGTPVPPKYSKAIIALYKKEERIKIKSGQLDLHDKVKEFKNSNEENVPLKDLKIKVNDNEWKSNILPDEKNICSKKIEYSYDDPNTGSVFALLTLEYYDDDKKNMDAESTEKNIFTFPIKENYKINYDGTISNLRNQLLILGE